MMQRVLRDLRWGSGSATGPSHIKAKLPNQDAYAVYASPEAVVAAVADGLGSRPFSHEGSRWAATVAVSQVVDHLLTDAPTLAFRHSLDELKGRILKVWRSRFGQNYANFDTTLVLAAVTADRAIIAQLGDGLILINSSDGGCSPFTQPAKPFLNITDSLAHPEAFNLFRIEEFVGHPRETLGALFLLTDGVADDLSDPARFCADALAVLKQTREHQWGETINSWLKAWPTPGHQDDKTLVVLSFGPTHLALEERHDPPTGDDSGTDNAAEFTGVTPSGQEVPPSADDQRSPSQVGTIGPPTPKGFGGLLKHLATRVQTSKSSEIAPRGSGEHGGQTR